MVTDGISSPDLLINKRKLFKSSFVQCWWKFHLFWETIGNEVNFFLFNVQIFIDETKKKKKSKVSITAVDGIIEQVFHKVVSLLMFNSATWPIDSFVFLFFFLFSFFKAMERSTCQSLQIKRLCLSGTVAEPHLLEEHVQQFKKLISHPYFSQNRLLES